MSKAVDLRTAPIDNLDLPMLDAFLAEGHDESLWCDYRSKLDKKSLSKCVAAFANTQGGVALVGVEEAGGKPGARVGIEGEPHKIEEQVEAILYDSIRPSVRVQVRAIEVDPAPRCVVVVRVPLSTAAPHALGEGSIYIRSGQHSQPNRTSDLRWLEHLFERRREPERLKARFDEDARKFVFSAAGAAYEGNPPPIMIFTASTAYPSQRLFPERQVPDLVARLLEHNPLPYAGGALLRRQWFNDLAKRNQFELRRVHVAGHVFFAEPVFLLARKAGEAALPAFVRGQVTSAWAKTCAILYLIGYRGTVNLRLDFTHAEGLEFVPPEEPCDGPVSAIVDEVTSMNDALLIEEALRLDSAVPILREMFLEVMWALGYRHPEIPDKYVRDTLDEALRWVFARSEPLKKAFDP